MIPDDLVHSDNFAEFRDPLSASVGYHFGDEYGCVPCRFKWFDSVGDLTDHILNVELPLCDYDKFMHEEFRTRLSAALAKVEIEGLTEEAREFVNSVDWPSPCFGGEPSKTFFQDIPSSAEKSLVALL